MRECDFYNLIDVFERAGPEVLPGGLRNYQPTVQDIEEALLEASVEEMAPVLLYFAMHGIPDVKAYCTRLLAAVPLSAD